MMRYLKLLQVFISAATIAALTELATPLESAWHDTHVKHTWNAVPDYWESLGFPSASTTIDLYVVLKPQHENALIDVLYEVSDPTHPKYGAHLSKEQVAELVTPNPETLKLVNSWLEYHGVFSSSVSTTHGGSGLTLTGVPVSQANKLLGASYQLYRHIETNVTILRTVGYSLPTVLHTLVQTIAPTTCFAFTRTVRQTPRRRSFGAEAAVANTTSGEHLSGRDDSGSDSDSDEFEEIAPAQLIWLYNTFGYVPASTKRLKLGIMGFDEEGASPTDLTDFMARYFTGAEDATFKVEPVNGGKDNPKNPTLEASLDVQFTEAFVYPIPIIFYSIGGGLTALPGSHKPAPGDSYLEWFKYLLDQTTIPQTILAAVGIEEKDLPIEYAKAVCDMFAQLGVRGASVIFSSGDEGVGLGGCKTNDGTEKVQFSPLFPASCPYVTAVGGTQGGIGKGPEDQHPELQVAMPLSGGGFSFYFERPPYQIEAVPPYVESLGNKYAGFYNPAGRGYPDISAFGRHYVVYKADEALVVDGTSCSAPTVAGIITLLNDYQLFRGRKPLGFLNPRLYGHLKEGFTDITSGNNPGCGTEGFSATKGWDPVTGLGTPDFLELQYLLDNPAVPSGRGA